MAERIFHSISLHHGVLYLQEFIRHGSSDIRAFVLGGRVLASMRRVAEGWKTNVSQGARPVPVRLGEEMEELAVKASEVIGCMVAGVDILESEEGPKVIEVNSQPGWRSLQTVTRVNIADEIIRYLISVVKIIDGGELSPVFFRTDSGLVLWSLNPSSSGGTPMDRQRSSG